MAPFVSYGTGVYLLLYALWRLSSHMELVCINYCTLYGAFRLIWNWWVLITVRFMAPFLSYGTGVY